MTAHHHVTGQIVLASFRDAVAAHRLGDYAAQFARDQAQGDIPPR